MTIYKNALGELVITKAHLTLPMKIAKKHPADDFNEHKSKLPALLNRQRIADIS